MAVTVFLGKSRRVATSTTVRIASGSGRTRGLADDTAGAMGEPCLS
jgi:hypothetical protein